MMAKMKISAKLLPENEIGQWGVFLSHSGKSETIIEELCEAFDHEHINYLWDKQIAVGSTDFAEEISKMINKCMCAVIVVNELALDSQWVNYEIGLLDGLGKHIFLYDKDKLLSKKIYRYHYDKFCPAYSDVSQLIRAVKEEKMFYSLFNHETAELTDAFFKKRIDDYVVPVQININIPGLGAVDPASYQVKALVISFGNFTGTRYNEDQSCAQTGEDTPSDICEETASPCCLNTLPDRKLYPECVLLNHVWDKITVSGDNVEIILPLHKVQGTTFKLFMDADSGETADEIFGILDGFGISVGLSKSGTQNRIYFQLRSSALNGVFRLNDEFSNNFICPGILRL